MKRGWNTRHQARTDRPPSTAGVLMAVVAFFALLFGLIAASRAPAALFVAYAVPSAVLFALYGMDKAAAQKGTSRTPEVALHLIALIGGWPGALVGQRVFRHKTRKQPFQALFWGTVAANCLAVASLFAGWAARRG